MNAQLMFLGRLLFFGCVPSYFLRLLLRKQPKSVYSLSLKLMVIDHQSVELKWNRPQDTRPLFELSMNEGGRNWEVIYKGFHTFFYVKYLYGGHTYKFKLTMESNNKRTTDSDFATASCTTKNELPSITSFHHSTYHNLPLLFSDFLNTRIQDINIYDELGECGLYKACIAGNNDMVRTLLQYGADVNLPTMFAKTTSLMAAAYHGHCDVIRILAHNNADATMKDINSKTALHYAVDGSQNNSIEQLLEGKWSDINAADSKGWTPLMRGVLMSAKLDVIKTLVDYGSDLSIKDENGQDVWQLARLSNNWKALKILPD